MTIAMWYMVGLLALMALGQLVTWRQFVAVFPTYGIVHLRKTFAVAFLVSEALAAALILVSDTRLIGALLALAVALAWTALASKAFMEHRTVVNCGCFGGIAKQPLRWWVLVEDALFIALGVFVVYQVL